jgi:hypothetical protein
MIQPAAPSVSITLAPGLGAPAPAGDEAAVSLGFAALLETTKAAGETPQADVSDGPAPAIAPADFVQARQNAAKHAGKKLPGQSPDLRTALKMAATSGDQSDTQSALPVTHTLVEAPSATPEIVLPGLIVPASVAQPQTQPSAAPAERSIAKSLLRNSAAVLPLPIAVPAQSQPAEPQPGQPKAMQPQQATPLQAPARAAATRVEVTAAVPAKPAATEPLLAAAPAPVSDKSPPVAREPAPAQAASASPPAQTAEAIPVVTRLAVPAASPSAPLPGVDKPSITPMSAPGEIPPAPANGDTAQVTIPRAAAPAAQPTATVLQASGRVTAQARTAARSELRPEPRPETSPSKPVAAKADDKPAAAPALQPMVQADAPKDRPATAAQAAAVDSRKPEPAEPARQQPALATPQPSLDAPAIVPVADAPKTTAEGIQSGHDFAELVDRLVEAREAASPDTVRAAISHSEFGQVSLRFDQDANGLSVSMTSADPDFAGAVQASAASAQAQTQADGGSHQRQDSQGQQQPQTQAQTNAGAQGFAQAHSQSSARDERAHQNPQQTGAEARFGRPSSQQRPDDGSAVSRGGIYA